MQLKWPMLWDLFSLFPAHAGVILIQAGSFPAWAAFPRTRGGDPLIQTTGYLLAAFSPHTRG